MGVQGVENLGTAKWCRVGCRTATAADVGVGGAAVVDFDDNDDGDDNDDDDDDDKVGGRQRCADDA